MAIRPHQRRHAAPHFGRRRVLDRHDDRFCDPYVYPFHNDDQRLSSVMLDIRDRVILLSRPVDARTAGAVKLVHIFIYLSTIAAASTLLPIIAVTVSKGWLGGLVFLCEIILMMGMILSMTAGVYAFVMRFWDGEKLKDMITYVQIALAIGMGIRSSFVSLISRCLL